MAKLLFTDKKHLKDALDFSREHRLDLVKQFRDMAKWIGDKVKFYPDFCKHSFYFEYLRPNGTCIFNGGLILHGYDEAFAVEINNNPKLHYSIHT